MKLGNIRVAHMTAWRGVAFFVGWGGGSLPRHCILHYAQLLLRAVCQFLVISVSELCFCVCLFVKKLWTNFDFFAVVGYVTTYN